jgi:hypothetical protein
VARVVHRVEDGSDWGRSHWRADEIGYFWPDIDGSYSSEDVVAIKKDIFYHHVTTFLDRVNDILRHMDPAVVRSNLVTCVTGGALA